MKTELTVEQSQRLIELGVDPKRASMTRLDFNGTYACERKIFGTMTIEEYLRWRRLDEEQPPKDVIVDCWQKRPDRDNFQMSHNIWNGKRWVERVYGIITHWRHSTCNYPTASETQPIVKPKTLFDL